MGNVRSSQWSADADKYTAEQVRAVLRNIGVEIESDTHSNFMCLCPFHGNNHTPSFTVGKTNGLFLCFNPACNETGNLIEMVRRLTGRNDFEAIRFIKKKGGETQEDTTSAIAKALAAPPDEWQEFPQAALDKLAAGLWPDSRGREYMNSRGFSDDTLSHFGVGYSQKKDMVTVPVHNPVGLPVGLVGRSVEGKRFENSKGLPRARTLFNIHRAKRVGDIAIIAESSFDAMRIHQAGFPNSVAILGGTLSPDTFALLDRFFNMVIIFTDNDELKYQDNCRKCYPRKCEGHNPGRDIGYRIAGTLRNKNIMWASYDHKMVYPHGAKDAGDLTDEEIAQCINNSVSHLEYSSWGLYTRV